MPSLFHPSRMPLSSSKRSHRLTAYLYPKIQLVHRPMNVADTKRCNHKFHEIRKCLWMRLKWDRQHLLLILETRIQKRIIIVAMTCGCSIFLIIMQCRQFMVDLLPFIAVACESLSDLIFCFDELTSFIWIGIFKPPIRIRYLKWSAHITSHFKLWFFFLRNKSIFYDGVLTRP